MAWMRYSPLMTGTEPKSVEDLVEENRRLRSSLPPVAQSKTTLYVICVVILCGLAAAFVLAITFIRPDADNTSLITTVIGIVTPVVVALIAGAMRENALAVDGRLSQFLEMTARASRAEGEKKGIQTNVALATEVAREEGKVLGAKEEREKGEHE